MKEQWRIFQGLIPRLRPHLLPKTNAQVAADVRLRSGDLEPLRAPAFAAALGKAGAKKTIYRYLQSLDSDVLHWFCWATDVDITRGPVLDDTQERVYYTGDGVPKVTDATIATSGLAMPSTSYILGVPIPTKPTVGVTGSASGDPASIVVAYNFVTGWGEPGPVSVVSDPIDYYSGQTLTVSGLDGTPSGAYNITQKYVYIAQTDATGTTTLRFWKQVGIGASSTAGTINFTTLAEAPNNPPLLQPPSTLFGMMLHPNGFLVGFTTRKFCRSETFLPHGWPEEYQDPIGDDIVGGAIFGVTTVICTKGKTYGFIGSDPLNQMPIDLEGWQPCVSKRSIRKVTAGILYASPDGLVLVRGAGALILASAEFLTRDQWQAYKPETMHAVVHDDRYYCFFDNGNQSGCLIFEIGMSGEIRELTTSSVYCTAAFADHRRDDLFICLAVDNNVHKWNAGNYMTMTWRSGAVRFDREQAIGAAKVRARSYPVIFRLYDEASLLWTVNVMDHHAFTLPADERLSGFQVEVSGAFPIDEVSIGSSILELRRVEG